MNGKRLSDEERDYWNSYLAQYGVPTADRQTLFNLVNDVGAASADHQRLTDYLLENWSDEIHNESAAQLAIRLLERLRATTSLVASKTED